MDDGWSIIANTGFHNRSHHSRSCIFITHRMPFKDQRSILLPNLVLKAQNPGLVRRKTYIHRLSLGGRNKHLENTIL